MNANKMSLLKKLNKKAKPLVLATALSIIPYVSGCGTDNNSNGSNNKPQPECVNLYDGVPQDPEKIRNWLIISNMPFDFIPGTKLLTRWPIGIPIQIYTGDVPRFNDAVDHVESAMKGLITFDRKNSIEEVINGVVMYEGGAPTGTCGLTNWGKTNRDTLEFYDVTKLNIGGVDCPDDSKFWAYPYEVAEHELMHSLGFKKHFEGFVSSGRILKSDNVRATLMALYQNNPGTKIEDLQICSY